MLGWEGRPRKVGNSGQSSCKQQIKTIMALNGHRMTSGINCFNQELYRKEVPPEPQPSFPTPQPSFPTPLIIISMHSESLKFLLTIIVIACLLPASCSQCTPSFTLPNLIKDQVTLNYFNGQQQSYSYPFFPSMFSDSPTLAYSITQLDIVASGAYINYYLDVENSSMMFSFYFNAPGQSWTLVTLNIWITSRKDLIVSKDTLQSIAPGSTASRSLSLAQYNSSITANAKHILFIVGTYSALIGSNFSVNVSAGPVSPATATIVVSNGLSSFITNITVVSVIFDPGNSQFVSNMGAVSYKSFGSQTLNLYSNFLPVYYYLIGLNSFSITADSTKYFGYLMNVVNSTVLALKLPQVAAKYDSVGFSYLSIGVQPIAVCSGCNNSFITDSGCEDRCPQNSFPLSYASGAKACLQCPSSVGLKINDLGTGCSCLPGYQLLTNYQCIPIASIPTNCSGQNVIQNGSACICSPGTYNTSGQCLSCQSDQFFNTQLQSCSCTMPNQVVNSAGFCACQSGYYNVSSFCIQCPDGTVYLNGICSPSSCPENQVLSNGKCLCDAFSVKKGSGCVKCLAGTFPDNLNSLCSNCMSNCASCSNAASCQLCASGYSFDFASNSCISMGNATSSNVSLRTGFPIYTYTAIVFDFVINSAATLAPKTSQQLSSMVSVSYPPSHPLPYRTIFKQLPNKTNQIRITFDYRCLLPLSNFVVVFSFSEPLIVLNSTLPVTLSIASAQITATIAQ